MSGYIAAGWSWFNARAGGTAAVARAVLTR
jgi:hypothetical protein